MTVTIGAWWIPLSITVVAMLWAVMHKYEGGDYGMDLIALFKFFGAVILSLSSWLIWALLT